MLSRAGAARVEARTENPGRRPMLTVHHLGVSQSERIVWLCEELAIPYELKVYDRDPVTRLAPTQYKALHPLGTAPIITDGVLVPLRQRLDDAEAEHGRAAEAGRRRVSAGPLHARTRRHDLGPGGEAPGR